MWISWTQRPESQVPTTHLQNTSIALRYGAIITILKTSWTTRTLPEKDTKTNSVITDELSGPAVYILTGILPIEAQIHIKALTFFNNVCHQGDKNTEKKLEDN